MHGYDFRKGQEQRGSESTLPTEEPTGIAVIGVVAAGQWVEAMSDAAGRQRTPVAADPRYPRQHQYAFEVRGNAMDGFARNGDFLIVVNRGASGLAPRPGDIVIVTRTKGDLREVTARRLEIVGAEPVLRYDSTDPRYADASIRLNEVRSVGEKTSIDGIVVAVYRPLT